MTDQELQQWVVREYPDGKVDLLAEYQRLLTVLEQAMPSIKNGEVNATTKLLEIAAETGDMLVKRRMVVDGILSIPPSKQIIVPFGSVTMLYDLVLVKSGKETVYMTDTLPKVKARKRALETSQRKDRPNYVIREAEDNVKYRRPPSFNFDPSGDAGSKKYLKRKANAKRIKQKNRRKDHGNGSGEQGLPS